MPTPPYSTTICRHTALFAITAALSSCALPKPPPPGGSKDRAIISAYNPAPEGSGLRLAVKDLIDVKGTVTTAGSEYLYKHGKPATQDAACLAIARERGVHIVGKTNLSEFAMGTTGMNEFFGTPKNPVKKHGKVIPGGSSSGSGVVVATGMADVAFGTDTAGSIRVPAACNGIVGMKTTFGLVPLKGVFPLSPKNLDSVGPMARDIDHLVDGMDLLERGFKGKYAAAKAAQPTARSIRIGRLYLPGTAKSIDDAIDAELAAKGFTVVKLPDSLGKKWQQAHKDGDTVVVVDGWMNNGKFEKEPEVSIVTKAGFLLGDVEYPKDYNEALARRDQWRRDLNNVLKRVDMIAVPTLQKMPPRIPFKGRSIIFEADVLASQNTVPVNFAGLPALAVPVPMPGRKAVPTSVQFVGPKFSEAKLMNAGRIMESNDA